MTVAWGRSVQPRSLPAAETRLFDVAADTGITDFWQPERSRVRAHHAHGLEAPLAHYMSIAGKPTIPRVQRAAQPAQLRQHRTPGPGLYHSA